jgi:hypothetical protein
VDQARQSIQEVWGCRRSEQKSRLTWMKVKRQTPGQIARELREAGRPLDRAPRSGDDRPVGAGGPYVRQLRGASDDQSRAVFVVALSNRPLPPTVGHQMRPRWSPYPGCVRTHRQCLIPFP